MTSGWLGEREGLSAREGAVLALIVLGLSNERIADALHISMHATKTHVRSAYRRMGVTSRTQAISWGIHHGFQLTTPAARLNERGRP
jgi:ATP/maltotriose-dependent transcriptional regulator MalT